MRAFPRDYHLPLFPKISCQIVERNSCFRKISILRDIKRYSREEMINKQNYRVAIRENLHKPHLLLHINYTSSLYAIVFSFNFYARVCHSPMNRSKISRIAIFAAAVAAIFFSPGVCFPRSFPRDICFILRRACGVIGATDRSVVTAKLRIMVDR